MTDGNWVERGMGLLTLNGTREGQKPGGRLGKSLTLPSLTLPCSRIHAESKPIRTVMRADQTHRLLLNVSLFAGFKTSITNEKYVLLTAVEASKPMPYMLRVSRMLSTHTCGDRLRTTTQFGSVQAAENFVQAVEDRLKVLDA